jgi:hypothetical protein
LIFTQTLTYRTGFQDGESNSKGSFQTFELDFVLDDKPVKVQNNLQHFTTLASLSDRLHQPSVL